MRVTTIRWSLLLGAALALSSCKSGDKKEAATNDQRVAGSMPHDEPAPAVYAAEAELEEDYGAILDDSVVAGGKAMAPSAVESNAPRKGAKKRARRGGPGNTEQGPAPRAWFPETFLFSPLVVTDEQGTAKVDVRVPDRLTTWRVLGLAHSRNGSQAGATTSFQGTLPAYVDPVVPSFLRVGDKVAVPIQLINNSDEGLQTSLKVEVQGGSLVTKQSALSIDAHSSAIRYVEIEATKAGELRLMARMGDSDQVVRTIKVIPTGQPIQQTHSGTLAAPRQIAVKDSKSTGAGNGLVRLSVFPGALALLRSELDACIHRGGTAEDAFALLLAGQAPELLRSLGDEPDVEALRTLTILSTQKVMRHARVLSEVSATLIASAAAAHPNNPVLERLATRAISTIESSQAPDGTCGGQSGWTLQRLLVSTADCARAAHESPNVTIRARGAFERHAKEIADPYTAAAILAAQGATGELREALRKQVLEAISDTKDGAKILVVPEGVQRADGVSPSVVEATAVAILALQEVPDAPLSDLGATLLANYAPHWGWGDGRANLVAMQAVVQLFKDPIPDHVQITLTKDGEMVAEGTLTRDKVREVLLLRAEGIDLSGSHQWRLSAEPAVPGLGFALTLTSWVPWVAKKTPGSELAIEVPDTIEVGKAVSLKVQALVPSNSAFEIKLHLPAGAQLDKTSLDSLVSTGALQRYEQVDGLVTMHASPLQPAQRFTGVVRIIPTLRGSIQTGPATLKVRSQTSYLPPVRWRVR